jgi:hypothetical protein
VIGNRRPSEVFAVVATVDPQTIANSEKVSDWVDVGAFESLAFILLTGDMASETVDFKLEQAQDTSATGKKDLVTATQLAASATTSDNSQLILQCRAEDVDLAGGFRYVRARAITGGATGGSGCVVGLGFNARYGVGTDLATVQQIGSA